MEMAQRAKVRENEGRKGADEAPRTFYMICSHSHTNSAHTHTHETVNSKSTNKHAWMQSSIISQRYPLSHSPCAHVIPSQHSHRPVLRIKLKLNRFDKCFSFLPIPMNVHTVLGWWTSVKTVQRVPEGSECYTKTRQKHSYTHIIELWMICITFSGALLYPSSVFAYLYASMYLMLTANA